MRPTDPALRSLSASLEAAVAAGDEAPLREHLQGRALPALGGDLPPFEILRQALFLAPDVRSLARGLASLLGRILLTEVRAFPKLRSPQEQSRRERLLLDALRLAAELPAHEELFAALREVLAMARALEGKGRKGEATGRLRLPLWRALAYQQTDASLEEEWLGLLRRSPGGEDWTPGRRTLLLTAWRGLLWVPPAPASERSEIVDFDRIEKGLLVLEASVRERDQGEDLLEEALAILQETFPRSAEFWEAWIRPRLEHWPDTLREKAFEAWPGLRAFFWYSSGTAGALSLHWQSLVEHLKEQSPLEALFIPETTNFWDDVGVKNGATFSRKLQSYLHSGQAIRDSIDDSRKSIHILVESPTDVQLFAGSLLLHWMDPQPDLIRLAGGTALVCPCENASSWRKEWRVLEPPPYLTHFAFEDADMEHFRPKAFVFQQELAHQAVAVLAQYEQFERQVADMGVAFRQIEDQARELRRALVPEAFSTSLNGVTGIEATMAQLVQQRSIIASIPGLQPLTALHLSFAGPAPERYLRDLAALPSELKAAALDQLRRALHSAWNPLERLYLQAVTTLMALQDEDFRRALQELDALRRASSVLTVEHQVLKLHAQAGVGDRRSSVQLFNALEQKELSGPVQKTLDLLDTGYGLSGRVTAPDPEQHEEIIRQEAAMIEAASSLSTAA